ncbi:AraC family transcriptional regulator [Paracoccus aminophilus]|uniref:Transcriptional regulator, AraC family n=1 Tax=Paracoccus aminophilus JCM 7686 TaxID=1367847 RepID=S5Z0I4_PARAH|nr:AraC family transcriptional regulator [Paracoccus aminophilus]AGT10976.1 transcriptional regulator, AraC family [Paracoccus aminophilus JCM 7686]
MDPLSDILRLLRPKSSITAGLDAGGDWAIRFDDQVGRIKCYALIRGACWLALEGEAAPVHLQAGECFVLPRGISFRLASDLSLPAETAAEVFAPARGGGRAVLNGGGMLLVGSRFEVDPGARILLQSLPAILHLRSVRAQSGLRWSIERLMAEQREARPGAAFAADHLAQMMLLEAMRAALESGPPAGQGWFAALADPQLRLALGAIHADPARSWTLAELGRAAGLSRSVLAERFHRSVGETPMRYLTRWRMALAAEELRIPGRTLAQIAPALGYGSEAAFSTAFTRVMGKSPRRYASEAGML